MTRATHWHPTLRSYGGRRIHLGGVEVLELADDPGSTRPPSERGRHQYVVAGGRLWHRNLPPFAVVDPDSDRLVPWIARLASEVPRTGPVAAWARSTRPACVAVLRRLDFHSTRADAIQWRVCGVYRPANGLRVPEVEIEIGPIVDLAWHELPLPPCPDCSGALAWAEAGLVPGARECACGSVFRVEVSR